MLSGGVYWNMYNKTDVFQINKNILCSCETRHGLKLCVSKYLFSFSEWQVAVLYFRTEIKFYKQDCVWNNVEINRKETSLVLSTMNKNNFIHQINKINENILWSMKCHVHVTYCTIKTILTKGHKTTHKTDEELVQEQSLNQGKRLIGVIMVIWRFL